MALRIIKYPDDFIYICASVGLPSEMEIGAGSVRTDWKRLISYSRKRDARECQSWLPAASSTARSRDCDKKIGEGRVM